MTDECIDEDDDEAALTASALTEGTACASANNNNSPRVRARVSGVDALASKYFPRQAGMAIARYIYMYISLTISSDDALFLSHGFDNPEPPSRSDFPDRFALLLRLFSAPLRAVICQQHPA